MTAAEKIAALRATHEAATPGPWEHGDRQLIAGVNSSMYGAGRCGYCDQSEPSWVGKDRGEWKVTHVHERDEPWWGHGIYAHRPEGSLVVVNDTDEYGYVNDADAAAIAAAHNAFPALLTALEDVLELAYASDDGSEYSHHGHSPILGEPECPACWADSIRTAIEAALAEVTP